MGEETLTLTERARHELQETLTELSEVREEAAKAVKILETEIRAKEEELRMLKDMYVSFTGSEWKG